MSHTEAFLIIAGTIILSLMPIAAIGTLIAARYAGKKADEIKQMEQDDRY
jgi:hypothetical protein